jgi:predicted transcriptional regulator
MTAAFLQRAREICSSPVVSVEASTSLLDITATIDRLGISCVGVAGPERRLLGVVSATDLLHAPNDATVARDVMHSPPITVDANASAQQAAALMLSSHIHRVFVTEAEVAVGVIGMRDIMRVVKDAKITTRLDAVMSHEVMTVDLGTPIREALAMLIDSHVRGLVVVDGRWPIGAFTQIEAIRARRLPAEALAMPVEELMSFETICLDTDTPLHRVAGYAIAMKVRRILAVEKRTLKGIVTGVDLARIVAQPE